MASGEPSKGPASSRFCHLRFGQQRPARLTQHLFSLEAPVKRIITHGLCSIPDHSSRPGHGPVYTASHHCTNRQHGTDGWRHLYHSSVQLLRLSTFTNRRAAIPCRERDHPKDKQPGGFRRGSGLPGVILQRLLQSGKIFLRLQLPFHQLLLGCLQLSGHLQHLPKRHGRRAYQFSIWVGHNSDAWRVVRCHGLNW